LSLVIVGVVVVVCVFLYAALIEVLRHRERMRGR
jgi:hypothetical protein